MNRTHDAVRTAGKYYAMVILLYIEFGEVHEVFLASKGSIF